jgi:hypothetical protein
MLRMAALSEKGPACWRAPTRQFAGVHQGAATKDRGARPDGAPCTEWLAMTYCAISGARRRPPSIAADDFVEWRKHERPLVQHARSLPDRQLRQPRVCCPRHRHAMNHGATVSTRVDTKPTLASFDTRASLPARPYSFNGR